MNNVYAISLAVVGVMVIWFGTSMIPENPDKSSTLQNLPSRVFIVGGALACVPGAIAAFRFARDRSSSRK